MEGGKLTKLISAAILLFCCGTTVMQIPQDDETDGIEQTPATQEIVDEQTRESSTSKPATPTPHPQIEVNESSANIRSGPGINYPSIQFAFEGDIFMS